MSLTAGQPGVVPQRELDVFREQAEGERGGLAAADAALAARDMELAALQVNMV